MFYEVFLEIYFMIFNYFKQWSLTFAKKAYLYGIDQSISKEIMGIEDYQGSFASSCVKVSRMSGFSRKIKTVGVARPVAAA